MAVTPMRRALLVIAALAALTVVVRAQSYPAPAEPPVPFDVWLAELIHEANERGYNEALVNDTLVGLEPLPRVIQADRSQAELAPGLDRYLATRITSCVADALRSDQLVTLEYSLPIGDGLRFYEVRAVPSDRDRVLCLVRDMTEQKRAQHHARELQDELAHVGRVMALGTLTGSLAHEINQPLAAIMTNAHTALVMLEAAQPDITEVCAALNDIQSDSRRIDDVLRHLRSMLKKERRDYDPVDVNSLVTEVLALVHSDVIRRQISLDVALAPDLDRVYGDRIQLQQVVLNLLMNACEAVRSVDDGRRHVRVTTAAEDGRVVVSVSDRGIGFSDGQIDRMFEPFFTTTADGMGLGLSICRAIIDAHGGLISARPNPDHGLTCWFSLAALAPVEGARVKQLSHTMRSETWN